MVREIFTAFAGGHSPKQIARDLNTRGVPGPRGGIWRDTTIRGHHHRASGILRSLRRRCCDAQNPDARTPRLFQTGASSVSGCGGRI
ncbi:recombinase family protein [Azospirillum palustre]